MKNNVIGNEGCVCSGGSLLFFRDLGGHACCKYLLFLTQNFTQSICQGGYKDFLMLYFSLRYILFLHVMYVPSTVYFLHVLLE